MPQLPPVAIWSSIGLGAYAAAATLVIWLGPALRHRGAVAVPGPEGRGRAVPRGGGLAIVLVTLAAGVLVAWLDPGLRSSVAAWLGPAAVVAAVSLRDDFRPVPATVRLVIHVAAAAALVAAVGPLREVAMPGLGTIGLGAAAWPLTILWLVGMTNAFNFMDGTDGIAGITAAVAGAALAVAAAMGGCPAVGIVAASFAAAALGFLGRNWPPARIFMGDVGSTFCGFTIAALPLVVPASIRGAVLPAAALASWPFVFDAAVTLLRRLARGENLLEPHCGHHYQRLVLAGWSHRSVAVVYGLLAAAGAVVGVAAALPGATRGLAATAAAVMVAVPVVLVASVHLAEAGAACRTMS